MQDASIQNTSTSWCIYNPDQPEAVFRISHAPEKKSRRVIGPMHVERLTGSSKVSAMSNPEFLFKYTRALYHALVRPNLKQTQECCRLLFAGISLANESTWQGVDQLFQQKSRQRAVPRWQELFYHVLDLFHESGIRGNRSGTKQPNYGIGPVREETIQALLNGQTQVPLPPVQPQLAETFALVS